VPLSTCNVKKKKKRKEEKKDKTRERKGETNFAN
jgi:hypothetical protein